MMKYLLSILFLPLYLLSFSQETAEHDIVYLKNGSTFSGEITSYNKGDIEFELNDGLLVTFSKNEISRIVMAGQELDAHREIIKEDIKDYSIKGLYNISYGSFNSGNDAFVHDFISGVGIDNITGYQISQYLGIGLGIGYHAMSPGSAENILPLFLDLRGYIKEAKVSPFYNVNFGYGFTFENEEKNIIDSKGGMFFHPAVGFKVGSKDSAFMVDLGIKWAKAQFTYDRSWETREHKMTYRRLVLRLGIML